MNTILITLLATLGISQLTYAMEKPEDQYPLQNTSIENKSKINACKMPNEIFNDLAIFKYFELSKYVKPIGNLTVFLPICQIKKNRKALQELFDYAYLNDKPNLIVTALKLGAAHICEAFKEILNFSLINGASKSDLNLISNALKHGADINYQDSNGNTALHYAVINNNLKAIEFLLKQKANPNIENNMGKRTLHIAMGMK